MAPRSRERRAITDVVIYTRISRDKEGEEMGVQRQEAACRERADREGWRVTRVYSDNDISASSSSKKARPEFEAMMAAAEAGEVGCVLAYSNSRLTRRPLELERLIAAHERTGVEFLTIVSGDDDLSTAEGRMLARIKGSVDAAESEKISERVSAAARQRAELGRFHGGRPAFGYEQVKAADGKVTAWRHHPQHAAWVREAARRVLAGESLYAIANDWNDKGRVTGNSAGWRSRMVKRALTSPAVAGYREYGGKLQDATWTPILGEDDWQRLRALLGEDMHKPRPFPTGQTAAKHALSGLVYCGQCNLKMTATPDGPAFLCSKTTHPGGLDPKTRKPRPRACGKARINMPALEEWVFPQLLDYLNSDAMQQALSAPVDDDINQTQADLRAAIETDQERLEKLDDQYTDDRVDRQLWQRQSARLKARIEENRAQLQEAVAESVRRDGVAQFDPDAVTRGWDEHGSGSRADNAWRRTVASMFVERVAVKPHPAGVAITLTRRRGETDEQLADRRAEHQVKVLSARVKVRWVSN